MTTSADDTVELEVERVKRVTDKALLVEIDGVEYFVPKSVIVDGETITAESEAGDEGTMLVKGWWARDRGLE